jgi:hypothetical protein
MKKREAAIAPFYPKRPTNVTTKVVYWGKTWFAAHDSSA